MSDILRDLSTTRIITAIEENLYYLIPLYRQWGKAEVHDEGDIKWSITDIPFSLVNSIMGARLDPGSVDATILSIITKVQLRKVPVLWWIGPSTLPRDLGSYLEKHSFVNGGQVSGMAVDLANVKENLPEPAELTVRLVTDTETRRQWSHVCAVGFGTPDFMADVFNDLMNHVDSVNVVAYLGYLRDKPVATSLLIFLAGVAGIYNVATLPEARRQGIGAIMTLMPLQEARKRGYKVGILQATRMGVSVYRSLGFQEYCKIGQYEWTPEHKQGAG